MLTTFARPQRAEYFYGERGRRCCCIVYDDLYHPRTHVTREISPFCMRRTRDAESSYPGDMSFLSAFRAYWRRRLLTFQQRPGRGISTALAIIENPKAQKISALRSKHNLISITGRAKYISPSGTVPNAESSQLWDVGKSE